MKNTGGSAFPNKELYYNQGIEMCDHHPGMTIRDYFAAKAMQGIIINDGNPEEIAEMLKFTERDASEFAVVASWAYQYADAMLAERDEK